MKLHTNVYYLAQPIPSREACGPDRGKLLCKYKTPMEFIYILVSYIEL